MSEDFEPVSTEENSGAPELSHRRILWIMAIVQIAGLALSLIYARRDFTLGLLIGGLLAFLNYYWLKTSLQDIFDKVTAAGEKPRFLAARYFLRYAALGAIITIVNITKFASVVALLLGLSSIALAVVIEGFIRIFTTNNKNSSNREEL
jgi:hypothetical protein